ncbi:MAG: putative secreted hydrolase [Parasphingorhabdus sp.]|jgi:predicted secreted hydrolase
MSRFWLLQYFGISLLFLLLSGCERSVEQTTTENGLMANGLIDFLQSSPEHTFTEVTPEYQLLFPADHGPHDEFRQEWWYFTGILETAQEASFGIQLTFFRFNHGAEQDYDEVSWNHRNSWMSHFVLSDLESGKLVAFEDFSRGVNGLAGATAEPFSVWVNGWSVRQNSVSCPGCLNIQMQAARPEYSLDLTIETSKQPILHGDEGYSLKDYNNRIASYYYSYPQLEASGNIKIDNKILDVSGQVWMDHEWSSKVLGKGQSGWDWFGLHLSSGDSLMLFRLRNQSGDDYLAASYIDQQGNKHSLSKEDFDIRAISWWQSSISGARYPISFEISIPVHALQLTVSAVVKDQELNLGFRYWEGAVQVQAIGGSAELVGQGFMELTGY